MDSTWLTVLLSNDRWLFIEYFFGFCGVFLCFYICLWFQSVCCSLPLPLLLSALFRNAHRYFKFKFSSLQFFLHSGKLLSIPVHTEVVCPNFIFTPLLYKFELRILMSSSLSCSALSTWPVVSHFPSLHFLTDLPEFLAMFLCFIKCPYSTETVIGVFKENLPLD